MKISIPEGLQIDAAAGSTTEFLAKFKVEDDGQLSLISLDGVPVEDEGDDKDKAEDKAEDKSGGKEPAAAGDDMSEEDFNSLMSGISGGEKPAPPSAAEYINKKR